MHRRSFLTLLVVPVAASVAGLELVSRPHDDGPMLQAWIDAAAARGEGVFIPAGTYVLRTPVVVCDGFWMVGSRVDFYDRGEIDFTGRRWCGLMNGWFESHNGLGLRNVYQTPDPAAGA